MENYKKADGRGLICIPSGNHDMDRLARYMQGEELKVVFAFLLSMPGAPFIYYGDEIGMRYVENLTSVEGGYNRTGSRTPMQWDDSKNAGFSSGEEKDLYIPIDPKEDRPTVAKALQDEASLYHEVKRLIAIRQSHPALQSKGDIEFLYAKKKEYPLVYKRSSQEENILVVINPADRKISLDLPLWKENILSLGGTLTVQGGRTEVPPCFAGWFLM